jgi:hypothetical protein
MERQQQGVLDRDDDGDGPDRQRDCSKDVFRGPANIGGTEEYLINCVVWRCADIPENNPQCADRQCRNVSAGCVKLRPFTGLQDSVMSFFAPAQSFHTREPR